MRFLFVDSITGRTDGRIEGRRHFSLSEPLQYLSNTGTAQVAPGAVSEAIGQLASWYCLERNNFRGRPVFLFADRIGVEGTVAPGESVELEATIHELADDSLRFSGAAFVDGVRKQTIENCSGYFMPLAELEDPEIARSRFAALVGGGLELSGHATGIYDFAALAGETLALDVGVNVRTRQTFMATEPFYADHFPRFPVTPIVMLNEMIGAATARLLGLKDHRSLQIRAITDIKIRSFVRPGDTCETVVKVQSMSEDGGIRRLVALAEIVKDGRKILRGVYQYEVGVEG